MANLGERLLLPDPVPPVSVEERRHKEMLYALSSLSARIDDFARRPSPDVVVGAPDMGPVHEAMRVLAERDHPLHEPVVFPDLDTLAERLASLIPADSSALVLEAMKEVLEALKRLGKKVTASGIGPSGGSSGNVLVQNPPNNPVQVEFPSTPTVNVAEPVTVDVPNVDITVSALRDALRGSATGTLEALRQLLVGVLTVQPSGQWSVALDPASDDATRTYVRASLVSGTGNRTLYTVPTGKKLRVTTLTLSGFNSSATSPADVRVEDGSTTILPTTAPAIAAGVTPVLLGAFNPTFTAQPKEFATDVNVKIVTGTVTYAVSITGYLVNA